MKEHLGKIAVAGLAIGIAAFGLGYALEGSGRMEFSEHRHSKDLACLDATVAGNESTKNWAWDDADTITIAVPGTVHYRGGDGDQLVVRGPQEALAHIRVHGGNIETDCRGLGPELEITLPGRAFRSITLAGSGRLTLENINQPELKLTIAGSGSVRAQGNVEGIKVMIAGSGDAKLADLAMKRIDLTIAGSGGVEAAPKEEAEISIAGSGDVHLLSRPTHLTSHVIGSGRITQANL